MSLFNELKRRNVMRVGAAYIVVAWLVIQVVETIFPAFGFGDTTVRAVTIGFAVGLIPVLIFAWAFELTPEGLKKDSEVDRSQSVSAHTGKKLDRMIMVVLALALGYFAFDKFVLAPDRDVEKVATARQQGRSEALVESYGEKSIAVLAFEDMSQNKDQEYLSDGIAEELLNPLLKGEADAALASMPQATSPEDVLEGIREALQVMAYHALGQAGDSDAVLTELMDKYGQTDAYFYAVLLAYRNEADRAFEWLDKALEYGNPELLDINRQPLFANIYNDPRWLPLLESVGRSPAQLDAIKFEVTLPK